MRIALLTGGSTPRPSSLPVAIRSASDFDPFGNDQQENRATVARVADGDPATAWSTETYTSRQLGGLKPGVGVVLELDHTVQVDRVQLSTRADDWAASIHVAATKPATFEAWGDPRGRVEHAGRDTAIPVAGTGRYVLVWFTDLGSGPPFRLDVAEVSVSGRNA